MLKLPLFLCAGIFASFFVVPTPAQTSWSFAVSGDSRNCGDFVMPAIASRVKADNDAFYWHLGDFRAGSQPDQDLLALMSRKEMDKREYVALEWDDFLKHQMTSFTPLPVFLGRGNHELAGGQTRDQYVAKFSNFLNRPEIAAQRQKDGASAAPVGSWYHWIEKGVDFITLDNADVSEFSDAQLRWLRSVLDSDLKPGSGITTIVMGAHEALPHSTGAEHAMDDWTLGEESGELVYNWFYDAQAAGKHVYLIASHSHYYSPNIYNTVFWRQHSRTVVPGMIVGTAGAYRYALPKSAATGARTMVYGYVRGTVQGDGSIDFQYQEIDEQELYKNKWPGAPDAAIHECFIHNGDAPAHP